MGVRIIWAVGLCFALSGCATGYGPLGITGGYEDRLVSNDPLVYEVRFTSNGVTGAQKAKDLATLRGAELLLAAGSSRLVISSRTHDSGWGSASYNGLESAAKDSVMVRTARPGEGLDVCSLIRDIVRAHGVGFDQLERTTTMNCEGL